MKRMYIFDEWTPNKWTMLLALLFYSITIIFKLSLIDGIFMTISTLLFWYSIGYSIKNKKYRKHDNNEGVKK